MPQPKSVKIAGTEIEEVMGVAISLTTPNDQRGYYEGRTRAATVQLTRRATNTPIAEMFKNATNEDGRLNIINGTIVLQDSKLKETYTIDMKKAYIAGWEFQHSDTDSSALAEIITLQVGEMTLSGGGKSKSFKVPEFTKS